MFTDVLNDLFLVVANRGDVVATRPEVFTREVSLFTAPLPSDGNGALTLEEADDRGHGVLGRDGDEHVDMIGHDVALVDGAFFLLGQLMEDRPEGRTNLAPEEPPSLFGNEHHVVFAVPVVVG